MGFAKRQIAEKFELEDDYTATTFSTSFWKLNSKDLGTLCQQMVFPCWNPWSTRTFSLGLSSEDSLPLYLKKKKKTDTAYHNFAKAFEQQSMSSYEGLLGTENRTGPTHQESPHWRQDKARACNDYCACFEHCEQLFLVSLFSHIVEASFYQTHLKIKLWS